MHKPVKKECFESISIIEGFSDHELISWLKDDKLLVFVNQEGQAVRQHCHSFIDLFLPTIYLSISILF